MTRIYDYYGSHEPDIKRVRDFIADLTGARFAYHESSYIGEYYVATEQSGEELTVRSNNLEDEEGHFLQWPEYAEYSTIVFAKCNVPAGTRSVPYLASLREKFSQTGELTFLGREE